MHLGKLEQGQRAAREAAAGAKRALRIGVCDEVPVNKLARLLADYQAKEPSVDITLVDRSCAGLIQDLQVGVLDIGISLGETNEATLRAVEVWDDQSCIVLPPKHRLAQESQVTLEAVVENRVIVGHRECSCGARFHLDHFIRSASDKARIEGAAKLNVLLALVSAGRGVGLVSAAQAEAIRPSDITLRAFEGRSFRFRTFVLQRRDDASHLASRFFELARSSS